VINLENLNGIDYAIEDNGEPGLDVEYNGWGSLTVNIKNPETANHLKKEGNL